MRFLQREREVGSTPNAAWEVGFYTQGAGGARWRKNIRKRHQEDETPGSGFWLN
jgi:hypothetical protein